jgi:FixJ family two-component response regulator
VHAMKRGAVDFLTKPVRGHELLDAVQRALARGGRSAGNPAAEAGVGRSLRKLDASRARGLCACRERPAQ